MNPDTTAIVSLASLIISVCGTILSVINHTRLTSECCGRKGTIAFDIDPTRNNSFESNASGVLPVVLRTPLIKKQLPV
jgi:hypothetical protein